MVVPHDNNVDLTVVPNNDKGSTANEALTVTI